MKTYITLTLGLAALAACSPPTQFICDREAQTWDKYSTTEDVCENLGKKKKGESTIITAWEVGSPENPAPTEPPTVTVDTPTTSEPPAPTAPPTAPVKGNNGWGNGDQDAPANSGPNNNAENSERSDPRGKGKK